MGVFILSTVIASALGGVIEGFLPDEGGLKQGLDYLISVALLLIVLTPLTRAVGRLPELELGAELGVESGELDYASVDALAKVNSLTALRIAESVAERFSFDPDTLAAELDGDRLVLELPRRLGVLAVDLRDFVFARWGIETEVHFYE